MTTTKRNLIGALTVVACLAGLIALPNVSHALGINCRGSGLCRKDGVAKLLQSLIETRIDPNRRYANGQQIACATVGLENVTAYCAFLQNTGGTEGVNIKRLIHFIPDHGCDSCGSVPTGFPGLNDVSQGQLTINAVTSPCDFDTQAGDGFITKAGLCK